MIIFFKKNWAFLFVLFFSWWAIKPLFDNGFFPIHDKPQVERVLQMAQALRAGQFPVRWVGDLGYGFGYPIFNFYAPLAYYVGAIFNLLGFDVLLATKLMMAFGVILSGITMYFLAKEFWGNCGGLVAGLFYIYAPYHAVDIYVRGAVGEYWAMAFLPLVFLGLYQIFCGQKRGILLAGLSFATVIFSHNLTAMMLTPFLLFTGLMMFIFSKNRKLFTIYYLLFTIYALGLSAFYWLPAIEEMKYTKVFGQIGGGADFRDHFVFLDQLWASPWGFAGSAPGRLDGMSFMLGKLHILLAILAIFTFNKISLFSIFGLLFAVFLTTQYSQFIWELIKPMAFIQYPWRFLTMATFFASFLAGAPLSLFKKFSKSFLLIVALVLIAGLFYLNLKYFKPQANFPIMVSDYYSERNLKWLASKISDEYLPTDFPIPTQESEVAWKKIEVLKGEVQISDAVFKPHFYSFKVSSATSSEILVNLAYFPGWKVWVDDKPREVYPLKDGRLIPSFTPGIHKVKLRFTNTPIRSLANFISLFSLGGLFFLVFLDRIK